MIYFVLLVFLCGLVIAALWWKPGKSFPRSVASPVFAAPIAVSEVDRDIAIIVELLREDEAARQRAAAIARLKSLQESQ
jgi:hypothetical protein